LRIFANMTTREALQKYITSRKEAIIARINQASGRTARRLREVVTSFSAVLYGPDYIQQLEDGRGPTRNNTPSKPTLREAIEEWLQYAGISPRRGQTRRSLAYAIANSIHRKGTKLYQRGGRSGVLSETITERSLNNLLQELTDIQAVEVSSQVVEAFKKNLTIKHVGN
jgi:hypothetical protein